MGSAALMNEKMSEGIIEEKSGSEGQIPESSTRIEEANNNNVVGLKTIGDAKGNSSSSTIFRWQEDHGITREVLEQQFDKSRDDAAKTLKVSTSTLKRACRDLGISRWPTRKRKGSNSSLNQNDAVKKHKGGGSQPCPPADAATNIAMSVKVTYKDDTVRFPLSSSSSTMKYLEEQLERRFKIPAHKFSIKYQDEEDEWISIMCDSDLMYCMDVLRSCGKSVIKMRVTPKSLEFNENYLPSPVLPIQAAAQQPPNAASPTGKGVCREILEAPNTTPILLSEGNNTSLPQILSDHSVNTEYLNQEEELINYLSLPSGEYFEWASQPNDIDSVIEGGLDVESFMWSSSVPEYDIWSYGHGPQGVNLPPPCDDEERSDVSQELQNTEENEILWLLYDDEESSDVSQELQNREENEIVRQSWFEILTLPLRSAWKGMIRIWRNCCQSTPKG